MCSSKSESDIIRDLESDFGSNVDFESTHDQDTENDSDEAIAYADEPLADEPLADEEWSIEFNPQNKVREELEIELKPSQRGKS